MKALLAKIGFPKAVGMYLGEREITVSCVGYTPFGPVEIARHQLSYEPNDLPGAIERLFATIIGPRRRARTNVAVGVPALKVFFSTRPIQTKHSDPSPQILLREALQSPAISTDGLVVDLIKAQPGRRPVASIAACQRNYLTSIMSALEKCKIRPLHVEPAPAALLRAAVHRRPMPRRTRSALRVFLGENQGLAVLASGPWPLLWRTFELARGDEASAIISATRAIQSLSRYCGLDAPVDAEMIHGRSDLRGLLEFDWLQDQAGTNTEWCDEGGLDDREIAFGLALGALSTPGMTLDLARTLKSRPTLREIFPWGDVALQAAMLFCMGLLLAHQAQSLRRSHETLFAENQHRAWAARMDNTSLDKERRDLQQRVTAIRSFLTSRIAWTAYAHDLPTRLPQNAFFTGIQGRCDLETADKNSPGRSPNRKSLTLRGAAAIANDGSMPHEIDGFLNALREHPLLRRDFSSIELADLKQVQPATGTDSLAFFSVVCMPKTAGAASQTATEAAVISRVPRDED